MTVLTRWGLRGRDPFANLESIDPVAPPVIPPPPPPHRTCKPPSPPEHCAGCNVELDGLELWLDGRRYCFRCGAKELDR
jgi:hypothetical protein